MKANQYNYLNDTCRDNIYVNNNSVLKKKTLYRLSTNIVGIRFLFLFKRNIRRSMLYLTKRPQCLLFK